MQGAIKAHVLRMPSRIGYCTAATVPVCSSQASQRRVYCIREYSSGAVYVHGKQEHHRNVCDVLVQPASNSTPRCLCTRCFVFSGVMAANTPVGKSTKGVRTSQFFFTECMVQLVSAYRQTLSPLKSWQSQNIQNPCNYTVLQALSSIPKY